MPKQTETEKPIDGTSTGAIAQGMNTQAPEPETTTESIWDEKTMQRVNAFAELLDDIADQRSSLNAKKQEAQAALIKDGFNKDALKAAIKYANTPEDKRENFDMTYMYCRKALGHPVQDDLFMAAMQRQVKIHQEKKH